jgi:hypothetical protein
MAEEERQPPMDQPTEEPAAEPVPSKPPAGRDLNADLSKCGPVPQGGKCSNCGWESGSLDPHPVI